MRLIKLIPLFFLAIIQMQQKGCDKEAEPTLEELTADVYDMYVLDMPYDRTLYKKLRIKNRSMMEVSTEDLPADDGSVVRVDSFDIKGRIIKTAFLMENAKDSVVYEYKASGQIEMVYSYLQNADTTQTKYSYDQYGMMTQIIYYRDKTTIYELDHNKFGKMTDKKLSSDSPAYSNVREIYRYDSWGRMTEALILNDNKPTAKQKRYYDPKKRISKVEQLANGIVMSSSSFLYNENGLLGIRKDEFFLSTDDKELKIYEFLYEFY